MDDEAGERSPAFSLRTFGPTPASQRRPGPAWQPAIVR